jgi:palmitoyltransferase
MPCACRNGLLSVVQLLINHGADPALTDGQGFNTLHLAVHSHNPMLLAYLLSQQLPLSIDSEDSMGQTGLQWACYQGDQISVSLLLKYGADPNRADAAGLTSVHWAAVKGSVGCIAKVVEAGGDCLKKDNNDMNPVDLARRQHSVPAWTRAMESIGREIDGRPKKTSFLLLSSDKHTKVAIFFLPLLTSFLILKTLEILPWHTGMLLSAAEAYGMHHVITRVLLDGKVNLGGTKGADALQKSPYLVAILTSSIFWVGYDWLSIVVGSECGVRALSIRAFAHFR